jgi:hypothetical protein
MTKTEIIHDMRTLKSYARKDYIKLHEHTGQIVRGPFSEVRAWYIYGVQPAAVELKREKGITLRNKYVSGSIFPYCEAEWED